MVSSADNITFVHRRKLNLVGRSGLTYAGSICMVSASPTENMPIKCGCKNSLSRRINCLSSYYFYSKKIIQCEQSIRFQMQTAFFFERCAYCIPRQARLFGDMTHSGQHALFHALQAADVEAGVGIGQQRR